jgi:hypothetical protein
MLQFITPKVPRDRGCEDCATYLNLQMIDFSLAHKRSPGEQKKIADAMCGEFTIGIQNTLDGLRPRS